MPRSNTQTAYGSVAKTFHWLTALLIAATLPLGIIANDAAAALRDPALPLDAAQVARAALLFSLHKTLGIATFVTALARIAWALGQPRPRLLHGDRPLQALLATTVHWLLYGSLILVPLTGWLHHAASPGFAPILWPFGQGLPLVPASQRLADITAGLHIVFERVLILAILLHVAGALKHQVIDRDATLRRMLPGRTDARPSPRQPGLRVPLAAALVVWSTALTTGTLLGLFQPPAPATTTAAQHHSGTAWQVTGGSVTFGILRFGTALDGSFTDWSAAITFDPAAQPTDEPVGAVEVTIAIDSLRLESLRDQALGYDFFDATTYPTARFEAEIVDFVDNMYDARGTLTLRGRSLPVVLPFSLHTDGDIATMSGSLTLDRRAFGIGDPLTDEAVLAFPVEVRVNLTAQRRAP